MGVVSGRTRARCNCRRPNVRPSITATTTCAHKSPPPPLVAVQMSSTNRQPWQSLYHGGIQRRWFDARRRTLFFGHAAAIKTATSPSPHPQASQPPRQFEQTPVAAGGGRVPRKLLEVDKPRGVASSLAGTRNSGPRTCHVRPSAVINVNFLISMIYRASCLQNAGSPSKGFLGRMYKV